MNARQSEYVVNVTNWPLLSISTQVDSSTIVVDITWEVTCQVNRFIGILLVDLLVIIERKTTLLERIISSHLSYAGGGAAKEAKFGLKEASDIYYFTLSHFGLV